jgi:hypothetical protein
MRKLKKIYHMLQLLGMVINYSRKKVSGGAVIVELAVEPWKSARHCGATHPRSHTNFLLSKHVHTFERHSLGSMSGHSHPRVLVQLSNLNISHCMKTSSSNAILLRD